MRKTFLMELLASIAIAGCSTLPAEQARPPANTVNVAVPAAAKSQAPVEVGIENFSFTPAELSISAGTKVTWINHDDVPHTATSTTKLFNSGALDTDSRFSYTFTTPGAYDYFCAVHPHMTGKIIVK